MSRQRRSSTEMEIKFRSYWIYFFSVLSIRRHEHSVLKYSTAHRQKIIYSLCSKKGTVSAMERQAVVVENFDTPSNTLARSHRASDETRCFVDYCQARGADDDHLIFPLRMRLSSCSDFPANPSWHFWASQEAAPVLYPRSTEPQAMNAVCFLKAYQAGNSEIENKSLDVLTEESRSFWVPGSICRYSSRHRKEQCSTCPKIFTWFYCHLKPGSTEQIYL